LTDVKLDHTAKTHSLGFGRVLFKEVLMADPTTIADLVPDPENARVHGERNLGQIVHSVQEVGLARSIVIDENNMILAGNGVTEAAGLAGLENVQVVDADGSTIIAVRRSGLTVDQKKRLSLWDNRSGELAVWDVDQLKLEFDLGHLDGMFNQSELERLGVVERKPVPEPGLDLADELQAKWQVQPGQLWSCGAHLIICGDSTDATVYDRLLGAERPVITFTDPPYNVNVGGQSGDKKARPIANDNLGDDFYPFIERVFKNVYAYTVPGAILYMCMSIQEWPFVDKIVRSAGFHWSSTIIWVKDSLVLSRKDYHAQFEPIWGGWKGDYDPLFYGWKGDGPRVHRVTDRTQSDVWVIDRPKRSDEHPTMKPPELVERALVNSSNPGDLVLDPFSGSGTTLCVCESVGRVARVIELAPKYVSVCLERWSQMGSGVPALIE
jgi:DNA modification methylase